MSGLNLFLFLLCIGLSGAGAWWIGRFGHRFGLLDKPNDRSSHNNTTAKGGGIGILAGFIAAAILLKVPVFFGVPAVILSLISFVGDRFPLSTTIRLLFQFAASFIFLFGFWNNHPLSTAGFLMVIPLALYIVGTTNYYNFMDGINGLAAITGVVGFGLLAFYGDFSGNSLALTPFNLSIVFCCLGFLPFNMPNAKVFMGDVGSILLGFVFAVMVVWYSTGLKEFLCLASFLFPFYADEITTELIRLKNGEKIWLPHRKHLYQLLANEYNISHWKISLGYGIGQLIIGASILFLFKVGIFAIIFKLFLYFCIFSVVSFALRKKLINEI